MRLNELKSEKLGICVSGGLDSKTVARRLKEAGADVLCFTADLGQPDEKDINDIKSKMAPCGVETIIVDLKHEIATEALRTIKAQAMYDGGYWNSTGLGRAVTVKGLIHEMKRRGVTTLVHGATGRGNDQMRFERYTNVLAPEMKVYAPWRDPELLTQFPGRTQMADYLNSHGIQATVGGKKKYSTDANLAGLSHEAEDLESLETPVTIVEPIMGVWPHAAPDRIEEVSIRFVSGVPIEINGIPLSAVELLKTANMISGRNGIWMKNALENRIVGTKSRGVYEAPGMELLGFALRQVYQAVLDKRSNKLFQHLSSIISEQIYEGRYFDPVTHSAQVAIDAIAAPASGLVTLGLYRGNMYFYSLTECPASLYNEADSSMEASDGLNPVNSQGYVEIQRVEAIAMAKAGQIQANY
ncbi:argininosuccinate synthase [bacterium]|nr:argininosuccinate synthase [bacterium]